MMADSLSTRVGRVIAGSAHALVSRLENQAPVALMEQSIREVNAIITEVRHELGQVSANRHLTQQQHTHLSSQHAALAEQAQRVITENRDDLASAAIARQLDIETQLPTLHAALAELSTKEKELSGYISALLNKKQEMEQSLHAFYQSRQAATHSVKPNTATNAAHSVAQQQRLDAATDAFERLYHRQTGLPSSAAGASLEQAAKLKELNDLARQQQIAERLNQLRHKTLLSSSTDT